MKIILAVPVLLAASALAGVAQPQLARSADPQGTTITTTGSGSVETVPDRATFFFTVTTTGDTARAALAANGAAAAAVVAALKGAKVQTSGLTLDPRLDESGATILGYTASTTVSADSDLSAAGGLVDAAVAAGATAVSGPSFSRSDRNALYRRALKDALADAKEKASALAAAAGLTLGAVRTVSEGEAAGPPLPLAAAEAAKLEPGTQTVDAAVTVTYGAG